MICFRLAARSVFTVRLAFLLPGASENMNAVVHRGITVTGASYRNRRRGNNALTTDRIG